MLVLEVWTRFWISKMSLLNRLTFFLENWTSAAKNKYTFGRFNRWINTVFQINSKNVGRETESGLSRPSLFYRSEAQQQAEALSTKIVFVRRNFPIDLSLATYRVRFNKWIVEVRILHLKLHDFWATQVFPFPKNVYLIALLYTLHWINLELFIA